MRATREHLTELGLPGGDDHGLTTSEQRFPDGAQYRVEIPSTEGPDAFEAVMDEARLRDVPVHRISQGSGIMLQTNDEVQRLVEMGREHDVEVSLFTGPRAAWDVGVQVTSGSGRVLGAALRGGDQLRFGIEDVRHACDLGIRSVLVADLGQLWVLGRMRDAGDLPPDLVLKVSVSLPVANPATAKVLEDMGASTLNLPVDLTLAQIAAIRQAVACPLDVYVEGPDDFGSPVRHYEIPELVRVGAPIHLKFTVRNAPNLYPSGGHIRSLVLDTARERVRRAQIGLAILDRYMPGATCSPR